MTPFGRANVSFPEYPPGDVRYRLIIYLRMQADNYM